MVPSVRAAFPHELPVSLSAMGAVALLAGVRLARAEDVEGLLPKRVLDAGVGHPPVSERWFPQLQHGVVLGLPPVSDAVLLQVGSEAFDLVRWDSNGEVAVRDGELRTNDNREMDPQTARKTEKKRTNPLLVKCDGREVAARQVEHRHAHPRLLGELVELDGVGKLLGHRSK